MALGIQLALFFSDQEVKCTPSKIPTYVIQCHTSLPAGLLSGVSGSLEGQNTVFTSGAPRWRSEARERERERERERKRERERERKREREQRCCFSTPQVDFTKVICQESPTVDSHG